jgi:alpha-tubulin suppressor-like RCC1 family protein
VGKTGLLGRIGWKRSVAPALVAAVALAMASAPSALASTTGALAWGANDVAQLGVGFLGGESTPRLDANLTEVAQISGGSDHGAALLEDGTAMAWGLNGSGQLGIGNSTGPEKCKRPGERKKFACSRYPVVVKGLREAVAVSAGGAHNLALLRDGTVMAWGANGRGQLGNGGFTPSKTLAPVAGLSGVKAIAAGNDDSFAVLSDGTVMAWGYNERGVLGVPRGTTACGNGFGFCVTTPTKIEGLSGVTAIASRGEPEAEHALALLQGGSVMAWGWNQNGQLGDGTQQMREAPVPVPGVSGAVAVGASVRDSTALLGNGTVMDWGGNRAGELGMGSMTGPESCSGSPCSTKPVAVEGLSGVTGVADGGVNQREGHTLALLEDGTVMAWGSNNAGQLGRASEPEPGGSPTPLQVPGVAGIASIAAGGQDSFAYSPTHRPVVTKVSPKVGPVSGGTTVKITGKLFTGVTSVTFVGSLESTPAASFKLKSSEAIVAVSPAMKTTERTHVVVTTAEGESAWALANEFIF